MGLDMYLLGKQYLWRSEEEPKRKEIAEMLGVDNYEVDEVRFDLMYWRKANAIHGWFVNVVQNENDDCGEYGVEREQLETLRDLCKEALDTRSTEQLPPTAGFFFGDAEINDYYWEYLQNTFDGLTKLLNDPKTKKMAFYYRSSW